MKYLFTGTGRCGTAYVARYLTAAGLRCTHEAMIIPFITRDPHEYDAVEAECSWVAQCFSDSIPGDIKWIHLVRDPRKVYDSFMAREFFVPEPDYTKTRAWFQGSMRTVDPITFDPNLSPGERCERWIRGTHDRLRQYAKVFLDQGDLHVSLEAATGQKLTRRELPVTNPGSGTQQQNRPAYINKLAQELGYQ